MYESRERRIKRTPRNRSNSQILSWEFSIPPKNFCHYTPSPLLPQVLESQQVHNFYEIIIKIMPSKYPESSLKYATARSEGKPVSEAAAAVDEAGPSVQDEELLRDCQVIQKSVQSLKVRYAKNNIASPPSAALTPPPRGPPSFPLPPLAPTSLYVPPSPTLSPSSQGTGRSESLKMLRQKRYVPPAEIETYQREIARARGRAVVYPEGHTVLSESNGQVPEISKAFFDTEPFVVDDKLSPLAVEGAKEFGITLGCAREF